MAAFKLDPKRFYVGKAIFWWFFIIGLVADLGSKAWAGAAVRPENWQLGMETPVIPVIEGVFAWKWAVNLGAAFSIFHGKVVFLAVVGAVALIAMFAYVYTVKAEERGMLIGLGLVASGAVGNVADRVTYGWVRDFLYFDFDLPFHETVSFIPQRYPVFNVADISILVGAVLLVVASYQQEKRAKAAA